VRGNVTFVKDDDTIGWSKSLKYLPIFTVRNIEEHRKLSDKAKGLSVMKTLQRGRKFKEEGYLKYNRVCVCVCDWGGGGVGVGVCVVGGGWLGVMVGWGCGYGCVWGGGGVGGLP
jgi:hypothetical protein